MPQHNRQTFLKIYKRLLEEFGPQAWWPAQTKFEVIVGAILTQNTNWGNVERAIKNLKAKNILTPQSLKTITLKKLAQHIRPAGYFNVKAKRLKNFMRFFFAEYNGDLKKMAREETDELRKKLLSVNGIGPETADSILLYALDKPIFVIDAYTKRIFYRHGFVDHKADYTTVQNIFSDALKVDPKLYNEYHALIVRLGKDFCKTRPHCEICPLNSLHYSLKYKCRHCHRVLLFVHERRVVEGNYLCSTCNTNKKFA